MHRTEEAAPAISIASLCEEMEKAMKTLMLCLLLAVALISPAASVPAAESGDFPTSPVNHQGKKWRIGYLEGGNYPDYEVILKATVRGLINLGWIQKMDIPDRYEPNHEEFWKTLSRNVKSDYLEFVPDAFYSANFDKSLRQETKARLIERLKNRKDIDLMIAMGTWAGQDLANSEHSVPTVVASCSDPIGSGIVKSAEDSGFDFLHAKVDPERYERQVRLFHDIIGFKKLGIVYEDSAEGKTFGGVSSVEKVAKERGFEVVSCFAPFNDVSAEQATDGVLACYNDLASKVDAIYVTVHRGITLHSLPKLMAPLYAKQIPSFSMLGSNEVRHGVLMSIAQAEFKYVGQFHAEVIARIFNGAKPRQLKQAWSDPLKIAINLETARRISYDPPVDVLAASDEIYESIEEAK
jgi:ABC-type uncharacterized transport system substrate-binding protein